MKATFRANSNIAFVKYWGKKDTELNLPMNPSISMTLDESVSTTTTVEFSVAYEKDELVLDGKIADSEKLGKVTRFLDIVREKAGQRFFAKVVSMNTFPMGSGIASSASGFAALAAASSNALGLDLSEKEMSALARRGSGSAARSIHGGFCFWDKEYAAQLHKPDYWPELTDIILIVDNQEKKVSSRQGMQDTVRTSALYKERQRSLPKVISQVKESLKKKDFEMLAGLIMKESDSMHTCMADTQPPLKYLNDASQAIKETIIKLNHPKIVAAYTFDAGPNAHIITLRKNVGMLLGKFDGVASKVIVARCGGPVRPAEHLF
jgi:diphosphomevalonate decarboxylase